MTTPLTLSKNSLASKAVLARLLATENLQVEHVPSAETAFFDVLNRRLVFPCWENMTEDTYDMLTGHETAHALFSPATATAILDAVKVIDPKNGSNAAKTYLNIVEDARIERLMKIKYPGLRRAFFQAYKELMTNPLVAPSLADVGGLMLIDRINLHYKFGVFVTVPFAAKEMSLVRECETTKTFEEVVDLARRLWEFQKQENEDKQDQEPQTQKGEGGQGMKDETETQKGNPSSDTGDAEEKQGTAEGDDGKDKGEKNEGGQDAETKAGEGEGKSEDGKQSSNGRNPKSSKDTTEPSSAKTESMMEDLSKNHANKESGYYMPATLPAFNTDIGVINFRKTVLPILTRYNTNFNGGALLAEWEATSRRDVSIMQQEFIRRMSADASSRTTVSDSGVIDVNRLWSYRIDDNIFSQYATVRNGQSHGIVVMVDFSGSMSQIMPETIRQMLMLAAWCRRSNIPCDVYGFSDSMHPPMWSTPDANGNVASAWSCADSETNRLSLCDRMRLIHIVSTKGMTDREWKITAGGLLAGFGDRRGMSNDSGRWGTEAEWEQAKNLLRLNGTPTVAASAALVTVADEFKRKNNLQIVHCITLTDGQPSDSFYVTGKPTGKKDGWGGSETAEPVSHGSRYSNQGVAVRDAVTGQVYNTDGSGRADVAVMNRILRGRVAGLNSVCISLCAKRDFRSIIGNQVTNEQASKILAAAKREGFVTVTENKQGYTQLFGVPVATLETIPDPFDSVRIGAINKTTLTKAFSKSLEQAGNNRLLCTRIVDLLAKPAKVTRKVVA